MSTTTMPTVPPERLRDLELRAQAVHPDEPAGSAQEVLALVCAIRELDAIAATATNSIDDIRTLAREWIASPDIQIVAAGRIMLAAVDGRQGANEPI